MSWLGPFPNLTKIFVRVKDGAVYQGEKNVGLLAPVQYLFVLPLPSPPLFSLLFSPLPFSSLSAMHNGKNTNLERKH